MNALDILLTILTWIAIIIAGSVLALLLYLVFALPYNAIKQRRTRDNPRRRLTVISNTHSTRKGTDRA